MEASRVISVTLNPSLDRTLFTHYLNPGYHNRTTEATRLDPGGHGVSVSRALSRLQHPTEAIILLGDDATARAYRSLIEEETFPIRIIQQSGHTRSNTIIVDTGNKIVTNIVEESTVGSAAVIETILGLLRDVCTDGDTVVCSGPLPANAPLNTYGRCVQVAHEARAQVVLAVGGDVLREALSFGPDLVVLRQIDVEGLFNFPVRVSDDAVYCANKLRDEGVDRVLVTDVGSSTVLVTGQGGRVATVSDVETSTHSGGSNEALVAGWLARQSDQLDDALAFAMAAGVYTSARVGTEFGSVTEVMGLMEKIVVETVQAPEV